MDPIRNDTEKTVWAEPYGKGGMRLVLDEVIGDTVFVREVDPGDRPPERVQLEPGQHIEVCTSIGWISINSSDEVGANDALYLLRVVPDGRDGTTVEGRTLRRGEEDDGRRVHVRPGESFRLGAGTLSVELDAIDDFYRNVDPECPEGSLAATLRVWCRINPDDSPQNRRLATAAAHRLDAAEHLLRRAGAIRELLHGEGNVGGPDLVVKIDELIHLTQEGIVALGRCITLVDKGRDASEFPVPQEPVIANNKGAIKAIRDAYEHIDERAVGNINKKVSDDRAYMIFDHGLLVRDNRIDYLEHRLDVGELSAVLAACRATIKVLVGGPPEATDSA